MCMNHFTSYWGHSIAESHLCFTLVVTFYVKLKIHNLLNDFTSWIQTGNAVITHSTGHQSTSSFIYIAPNYSVGHGFILSVLHSSSICPVIVNFNVGRHGNSYQEQFIFSVYIDLYIFTTFLAVPRVVFLIQPVKKVLVVFQLQKQLRVEHRS